MITAPALEVMRDVTIHAEPRALARPHRPTHDAIHHGVGLESTTEDALANERRAARSEGYEKGYAEGLRAGRADGERAAAASTEQALSDARDRLLAEAAAQRAEAHLRIEGIAARLSAIERAFGAAAEQRLRSLEADAIALAFEAVCRIVGEGDAAERAAGLVQTALTTVSRESLLGIRVHPDDLALLQSSARGADLLTRTSGVQWIEDATLTAGGCVLETRCGTVDARMETQLGRLRKTWAEAVRSTAANGDAGSMP